MLIHTVILITICFGLLRSLSGVLTLLASRRSAKVLDSRQQPERAASEAGAWQGAYCPACRAAALATAARPSIKARLAPARGRRRNNQQPLLPQYGLRLLRLGRLGQYPRQWASPLQSVAAVGMRGLPHLPG